MMRILERLLLLDRIDDHWKEHLHNIDYIEGGDSVRVQDMAAKTRSSFSKNEALSVFENMYQQIEETGQ